MRLKTAFLSGIICLVTFSAMAKEKKIDVIAYYTGNDTTLEKYPINKLTHVIYSFLHLSGDTIAFSSDSQANNLRRITNLKAKYPGLKVMISMGGWGGCQQCSPVFGKTFVDVGHRRLTPTCSAASYAPISRRENREVFGKHTYPCIAVF